MSLKAVLTEEQLGELDESTKALYAQSDDGNYVLDVEGVDDHPTVKSLKNGHANSKRERDQEKQKRQEYERRFGKLAKVAEDLDLSDAEEERLEALLPYLKGEAELPEQGDDPADKNPKPKNGDKNLDLEKIKSNARKPVERERDELKQRAEQAEGRLESLVIDSALTGAVSELKVATPYQKAVKAMFRDKVKVTEGDEGELVAIIEGEYGEQPVDKYLKEWSQTDEGKAFIEADRNNGGGARNPGGGGGKPKNPWSKENWNETEQARIYKEQGRDVAQRMAAEHGKRVL